MAFLGSDRETDLRPLVAVERRVLAAVGFMVSSDYDRVRSEMRLGDGTLWPIPVTLDLTEEQATELAVDQTVALRDLEGVMLAALHIEDIWRPDLRAEAAEVFGSTNREPPGVAHLFSNTHPGRGRGSGSPGKGLVGSTRRGLTKSPAKSPTVFCDSATPWRVTNQAP